MKAIYHPKYGSAEVLQIKEIEPPTPGPSELLINVKAISINALDWHMLRGTPYFIRLMFGLFRPKNSVLGADLAGEVVEVGSDVSTFQKGDRVFGAYRHGAFAEYATLSHENVALIPNNNSYQEAAAIPIAGITAIQAIQETNIQAGEQVLINGGSTGVGTFALQLCKTLGAKVTTVTSTRNIDMMRKLGADQTIDYTKEDFVTQGIKYDVILDIVGNKSRRALKNSMKINGRCLVIGYGGFCPMIGVALFGNKKVSEKKPMLKMLDSVVNTKDLQSLATHLNNGEIIPQVEKNITLEEIPKAVAYVESGRARGKVVATIA